jgi:hypothetical protein
MLPAMKGSTSAAENGRLLSGDQGRTDNHRNKVVVSYTEIRRAVQLHLFTSAMYRKVQKPIYP